MSSEGKLWDSHYSDRVEKCHDSVSVSYGIGSNYREVISIVGITWSEKRVNILPTPEPGLFFLTVLRRCGATTCIIQRKEQAS